MINKPYVLIVSTLADVATDDVVRRLSTCAIPHRRLNTEDYPFARTVVFKPQAMDDTQWLESEHEMLPPPATIWYRRLRSPAKPDGMDSGVYDFCLQENRATLLGAVLGCSSRWMSHPTAIWQSEHKPFQLSLAARVGLRIPKTVITNDPSAVRKAFAEFQSMVVKPVRTGHVMYQGHEFSIFTSRLLREHLDELESAKWSPAIYQELIPKRFDVRVTIVGKRVFAAAIDSQSDPKSLIDWRQTSNPQLPHYPTTLPKDVTARLLDLMDLLGLNFGAVDLIETPDGDYVFLEVNPNGQWLWIDDMLELGISDAIVEWLSGPTHLCQ